MNAKAPLIILLAFLFISSCTPSQELSDDELEQLKQQVYQTEKDFERMVAEKGAKIAFSFYADDEGVINRKRKVLKGKEAISSYYEENPLKVQLSWEPDFISVAASGDLAYTYGEATFTRRDSLGNKKENKNIFHTIWKR